jgi:methionine transaminase
MAREINSKLAKATTTIFTTMSALSTKHGAINLSQGFPDYPVDPTLKKLVSEAIYADYNQYAPMTGVPELRLKITEKVHNSYGCIIDPEMEVTITTGASQAISSTITAMIRPGDEVIVIEPAYDSYIPSVLVNGGIVRIFEMRAPEFKVDWEAVEQMINNNTKMLIINNPHNPTGTRLTTNDIDQLEKIVLKHGIYLLSDEVYEHLVYDDKAHHSILSRPALRSQALVVFSFGKTFHATGWKTGYIICTRELSVEFRKVHQFTVFSVNTPVQYALAKYMEDTDNWLRLPGFFQQKRDLFQSLMSNSAFRPLNSFGTYFQLYDYSEISSLPDTAFAIWLTENFGVATIPLSPFYQSGLDQKLIRICFAKKEETLAQAADRLRFVQKEN